MISPFTAFASEIERLVFPTAVGPVSTISGFFIHSYTIRLNFFSISVFAHGNDRWSSMRTVVWIFQCNKFITEASLLPP